MKSETLNKEKVKHWLRKTLATISNCPGGTDMSKNGRLSELCSRYNELKERAKDLGVWQEYCAERGWDIDHDGFDCAA